LHIYFSVQFLANISEVMKVSKKIRGDLLAVIVTMKSTRSNIHGKVNDVMASAVKEARCNIHFLKMSHNRE